MFGLAGSFVFTSLLANISINYIYSATLGTYEGLVVFIAAAFLLPLYPMLWYGYTQSIITMFWKHKHAEWIK